jgi:hypothetical protein
VAAAALRLTQVLLRAAVMAVLAVAALMLLAELLLVLETLLALLHLKETTEELEQPDRHLEAQAAAALVQPVQMAALQAATVAQELRLAFLARLLHTQAAVAAGLISVPQEPAAQVVVETVALAIPIQVELLERPTQAVVAVVVVTSMLPQQVQQAAPAS